MSDPYTLTEAEQAALDEAERKLTAPAGQSSLPSWLVPEGRKLTRIIVPRDRNDRTGPAGGTYKHV